MPPALHPLAPIPAAIYVRVSTEEQKVHGYSLEQQIEECQRYAERYGLLVHPAYIFQDAESGTIVARTGLDTLRVLIRRGEVKAIILYKVARFARNFTEMIVMMAEFARAGVEFYDTGTPPAPVTPERTLNLHIQGAIAQYEHAQILERTRNGLRGRAEAGYPLPQQACFGYCYAGPSRKGSYVIVEEEAVIVRRIFSLYVTERLSTRKIAHRLTLEWVPTSRDRRDQIVGTKRKQRVPGIWNRSTIDHIRRNRIYLGTNLYGTTKRLPKDPLDPQKDRRLRTPEETWMTIDVPQIIPPELFARAALQREANKRHNPRNTKNFYLLGGERLRCGVCKRVMGGTHKGP